MTYRSGVAFKLDEAQFFLNEMSEDLRPARHHPESRSTAAIMASTGAIVDHPWHRRFYFHLDAFLVATRSVPEIIQRNFGTDNGRFKPCWWETLSIDEQRSRKEFQNRFRPIYQAFSELPISQARVATVHRSGTPPVTVTINGQWGIYTGGPSDPVPSVESPHIVAGDDPALQWAATQPPTPLEPSASDFTLTLGQPIGKELPLFDACAEYLQQACDLAFQADQLCKNTHGNQPFTVPLLFD